MAKFALGGLLSPDLLIFGLLQTRPPEESYTNTERAEGVRAEIKS